MEVISESQKIELKEQLPQILMRIFYVCKSDPNFPLKDKIKQVEREIKLLKSKSQRQDALVKQSTDIKNDLNQRIEVLAEKNFDTKARLLEELGSGI